MGDSWQRIGDAWNCSKFRMHSDSNSAIGRAGPKRSIALIDVRVLMERAGVDLSRNRELLLLAGDYRFSFGE